MTRQLEFGHRVPEWAVAAWGARLIFPNDLVQNRQSTYGSDADKKLLVDWLNGGALAAALATAGKLAMSGWMRRDQEVEVMLYEDERGVIMGNPNASHGYLYVAAWFKQQGAGK